MKRRVILMRGLPGCGKSEYIKKRFGSPPSAALAGGWLVDGGHVVVCSMDHFFIQPNGYYAFDRFQLGQAASFCHTQVLRCLKLGIETIIVDNTHSRNWEMELTRALADHFGYATEVVNLFDGGCTDEQLVARNTHGVPLEVIQGMRSRWEY
jgi:predicted kinase